MRVLGGNVAADAAARAIDPTRPVEPALAAAPNPALAAAPNPALARDVEDLRASVKTLILLVSQTLNRLQAPDRRDQAAA